MPFNKPQRIPRYFLGERPAFGPLLAQLALVVVSAHIDCYLGFGHCAVDNQLEVEQLFYTCYPC